MHGGWCWRPLAELLCAQGHEVFTSTLTGLGDRAHLMQPSTGMDTFVQDVAALVETEELQNVTLVGHSFGGFVISGVADRMADRIASLVYLDATIGTDGEAVLSLATLEVRQARLQASVERAGTRVILPPPAAGFGLTDAAQIQWVDRRMTPMPFKAYDTPMRFNGPVGGNLAKLFIRCTAPPIPSIEPSARQARALGWRYREVAAGHDAMVSAPLELAALLLEA